MVSRRPIALSVTQTPFGAIYLHISTISWSLLTDRGHRWGREHRLIVGTDTAQICLSLQCIAKRSFLNLHISMALTQNYSVRTISTDGNTGVHVNIRTGRQANIVKSWSWRNLNILPQKHQNSSLAWSTTVARNRLDYSLWTSLKSSYF